MSAPGKLPREVREFASSLLALVRERERTPGSRISGVRASVRHGEQTWTLTYNWAKGTMQVVREPKPRAPGPAFDVG